MKSHSGYHSCTKCIIKGIYNSHRVCFPGTENSLRTDESFHLRSQKEHHIQLNAALKELNIGCVTKFPIDYMHCVLLGVTRQMLNCWIKLRKKECSLKSNAITAINENLKEIRKCLPIEFARKQRTLHELEHWKATEFRMFLCYTGLAALHDILPKKYYQHFLLLVCAIRILSNPKDCVVNNNCASQLIKEFVELFITLYGTEQVSYNVHSLLHLSNDVKEYGNLNNYSAFKFENFMQI